MLLMPLIRSTPGFWMTARAVFAGTTMDSLGDDARRLDEVQLREVLREIRVPLAGDALLTRAGAVGCALAVARVQAVHDRHPVHHLTDGREAHPVEVPVVGLGTWLTFDRVREVEPS